MHRTPSVLLAVAALLLVQFSVLAQPAPDATPEGVAFGELRLIGSQVLPGDLLVGEILVGGLSGIDYDPQTDTWIAVSDDRSDIHPARFYTLHLTYSSGSFDDVTIDGAVTLLQPNGLPYPNAAAGGTIPDFETIRFDPVSGLIWYGSEGTVTRSLSPFLAAAALDGRFVAMPSLPGMFDVDPARITGPRDNYSLEGFDFSADGTTLWIGMEAPLYQDGPPPTDEAGAPVRLTIIDRTGTLLNQVVYELDAIPAQTYEGRFFDTGLSEILVVDETRLLTVERSTVEDDTGLFTNYIRIYEIDITGATNVAGQTWLVPGSYTPVTKRLLLDLGTAGADPVGNIEGITWGPVLDNGNSSLILVSDNNFSMSQFMVFHAIEVVT
ncbi:MAG: esterase-like activity of phytase family protein [Thermomicrobiales bacterium]|nr:esterase-like activity of phytase family protein [Thermomicrobiales bacterium]